ncbi:MAG: DUF4276 family protein [Burkholderiaceae bacterium]
MLDEQIGFRIIPFEGKQDLERQVARKLRAYKNELARFIIVRDQDSHPECTVVKQRLIDLCTQSGKAAHCLVRIACTELESFYLADLRAVGAALGMPDLHRFQGRRKFRSPDSTQNSYRELRKLTQNTYQKIAGSRAIGEHLSLDNARSPSFQNLVAAIRRFEEELMRL